MNKWLVIADRNLVVASVATGVIQDGSSLSFQVINVDGLQIARALDEIERMRKDSVEYHKAKHINCGRADVYKMAGPNCSIVANNCRVLYHGSIDRLYGLSSAIRKSYSKWVKEDS